MRQLTWKELRDYIKYSKKFDNKILREELFAKNPYCYYCKGLMKMYPEITNRDQRRHTSYPHDLATIEHLYDRYDIRRYTILTQDAKVLACYKCNQKQANKRNKEMSKNYKELLDLRTENLKKRHETGSKVPRPKFYVFPDE